MRVRKYLLIILSFLLGLVCINATLPSVKAQEMTIKYQNSRIFWWLSPKKDHHKAVVFVYSKRTDGKKGFWTGTGCIVHSGPDGKSIVIAASHVVNKNPNVLIDGVPGTLLKDNPEADVCLIYVKFKKQKPYIPIATRAEFKSLEIGDKIELGGLGGPYGHLRTFFGYIRRFNTDNRLDVNAAILHGDSGGPVIMFNKDGKPKVIGTICAGGITSNRIIDFAGKKWPVLWPAYCSQHLHLRNMYDALTQTGFR